MKYAGLCLIGFALLGAGLLLALWKLAILAILGTFWTAVVVLSLIGAGIMGAAINGRPRRIEIDRSNVARSLDD